MIGFEITLNGQQMTGGIEQGVLTAIFTRVIGKERDEIKLDLAGLDTQTHEHVRWGKSDLKEGDEIVVRIVNLTEVSTHVREKAYDESQRQENLVKHYNALKEDLEKQGLI